MKRKKFVVILLTMVALLVLTACNANFKRVTIGGSTALQPIVEQASIDYMKIHKDTIIMVQGGGSGVGLAQVAANSFQIGNSDIFAEEKTGINANKVTGHKVAVLGIAPIVNEDTDVEDLTNKQLKDIFTGKITNWEEVGGQNQKITVIGRTSGSGTRVNFDKYGLDGATAVSGPSQDASGSVVQLVSQTPGAISYVAFNYKDKAGIKALAIDGIEPIYSNVANNSWKIWFYAHMYTNKSNDNTLEDDFIDFVKNSENLTELGYFHISQMKIDRDANGKITPIE